MAINERLIHTAADAAAAGTGNTQEGLLVHYDAADVDSFDGDNDTIWYDITNHEYTPAVDPSDHFNTVLYTGQGTAQTITADTIGFQPDLVWLKNRDGAYSHRIFDTVRGANERLLPDTNSAESTRSGSYSELSSFSDGFTLDPNNRGVSNSSADDYVAWCFKAGGTAVSNTDGSVTSQVSFNNDLGFSIVKTSGTSGAITFGHGLDAAPEMIINKGLTSNGWSWLVYHKDIGTGKYLTLNTTSATTTNAGSFSSVTSTTITNNSSNSSSDYINYCFASKRGVSKVGSYTGTGSSGNKVYTGFQPAWVMIKLYSNTNSSGHWVIFDNARSSEPPMLRANTSDSEFTGDRIDFNADGFTLKDSDVGRNYSGYKYMYLAFAAEKPDSFTPSLDEYSKGDVVDTNLFLHYDPYMSSSYGGTGTTLTDLKGNNNADLLGGIESSYNSDYGFFDITGSGDGITTSSVVSINPATTGMTVEMWVKIDSDTQNYLFSFDGTGTTYNALSYRTNTDTIDWFYRTGSSASSNISSPTVTIGQWHHLVATTNGSGAQIYLDGVIGGTTTSSAYSVNYNEDLHFGNYQDLAQTSNVQIGQIRFYKGHLTATDVKTNYDATKGNYAPELDLHLDPASYSGSGTTWTADVGNNGTLVGNTAYDEELGDFFDLDGSGDYISLNTAGYLDGDFTLEMWWNFDTFSSGYQMLWGGSGYSGATGLGAYIYGDGTLWTYISVSGSASAPMGQSGTVLTAGKWHHIVTTRSGGTYTNYVDGVQIQTGSGSTTSLVSPNTTIGKHYNNTSYDVDGRVGQVRVYNNALSADEVMQNYRFTKNDYPNGKHATLTSATWASEGSFSFQNGQYATIPVGGFIGDNDQIKTIAAWVKGDTTSSRVFPFTISSNSSNQRYFTFGLYNDNSKVYCSCRNGGSTNQWQDHFTITPDTSWHHIAVTFDGTTRKLYFDGDLQTTNEDNRGTATSSSWITYANIGSSPKAYIGRGRHVSSWYSDGKISDIKYFDKALTSEEVRAEYNKGQFGEN